MGNFACTPFAGAGGLGHANVNGSCPGRLSGSMEAQIAAADLNGSGSVNSSDLTLFAGAFGNAAVDQYDPIQESNLNHSADGAVNSSDLTLFAGVFGLPVPPC
jgi:hypothetical protein